MKKVTILFFSMIYAFGILQAQIVIQPLLPSSGLLPHSQLWNLILVNGSGTTYSGQLQIILKRRSNGDEVYSATASNVLTTNGANAINPSIIGPITYSLPVNADELIPIGQYTACYTFSVPAGESLQPVAQQCVSFDIAPLSPPLLIFPADSSELSSTATIFEWTPPNPLNIFTDLHYNVIITEIQPGQRPDEAVQTNLPFYTTAVTGANSFPYTNSLPVFQDSTWYVWQIVAEDQNAYMGKSEAWVFRYVHDTAIADTSQARYVELSDKDPDEIIRFDTHRAYLKFYSPDPDFRGALHILDQQGNLVQETHDLIQYGDNYLNVKLRPSLQAGKTYRIELVTPKTKIFYSLFTLAN